MVTVAQIGPLVLAMRWLLGIRLPVDVAGLPVVAILLAGLYGFGYVLGGLTLIFKRTEMLAALLTNLFIFFNGTLVSVERYPDWLEAIARLMPTTQGLIVLREVLLDGRSLAEVWRGGSLPLLGLHSAALLALGLAVYGACERVAKRHGTLAEY